MRPVNESERDTTSASSTVTGAIIIEKKPNMFCDQPVCYKILVLPFRPTLLENALQFTIPEPPDGKASIQPAYAIEKITVWETLENADQMRNGCFE